MHTLSVQLSRVVRVGLRAFWVVLVLVISHAGCEKKTISAPFPKFGNRQMTYVSASSVTGYAGFPVGAPLEVLVTDHHCSGGGTNCAAEVPSDASVRVEWTVSQGGGTMSATSTSLDAAGKTSVLWTLGPTAGTATATATLNWDPAQGGVITAVGQQLTFTATSIAGRVVIAVASGDQQLGGSGATLSSPVVARVTIATGGGVASPLANATVAFTTLNAGGIATPSNAVTDADGRATTSWRLGLAPGAQTLTATVPLTQTIDPSSVVSVNFRATAQTGAARVLRVVSGNQQPGVVGRAEPQQLVVEYVTLDGAGGSSPIPNATITFTPAQGNGTVSSTTATTNTAGQATVRWTLGPTLGAQTLQASTPAVAGVDPASVFNAAITATAEPADLLFQDDFSVGNLWTTVINRNDRGAYTHSAQNVATGGNPGGFRRMVHTFVVNSFPDFSTLFVQHMYTGDTYDPRKRGPIVSIDYSDDRQTQMEEYDSFVLVQNGVVYEAIYPNGSVFNNTTWQTGRLNGLKPSDFFPAPGPDFSASGTTMQFGFMRGNSARIGAPFTNAHDIDNWTVLIHR